MKMEIRGYEYLGRWNNTEIFQGHFYSIEIDHNKNEIRKYYDGSLRGCFSFEELEDLFVIYARKVTRNNIKKEYEIKESLQD